MNEKVEGYYKVDDYDYEFEHRVRYKRRKSKERKFVFMKIIIGIILWVLIFFIAKKAFNKDTNDIVKTVFAIIFPIIVMASSVFTSFLITWEKKF